MINSLVRTLTDSAASCVESATVHLLGGPYVDVDGSRLEVPEGSKRLLVFVALASGTVDRRHAAGSLWPDVDDVRAAGNLRSALWRLKSAGIDVVSGDKGTLHLTPATLVDVDVLCRWAAEVHEAPLPPTRLQGFDWRTDALDLLPGWYDDWVLFERERLRQRLLHAIEALAVRLVHLGRYAEAVDAALDAVHADPLRESAHRVLVLAHLAEGNRVEAARAHDRYAALLDAELGVEPSFRLGDVERSLVGVLPLVRCVCGGVRR
jgi:DNA-binding SARP family transcriptional activator